MDSVTVILDSAERDVRLKSAKMPIAAEKEHAILFQESVTAKLGLLVRDANTHNALRTAQEMAHATRASVYVRLDSRD